MKLLTLLLLETILFCSQPVAAQARLLFPVYPILMDEPLSETGKVTLRWRLTEKCSGGYFNVERGITADGPFEMLSAQKADSGQIAFIDEKPLRGRNFYRVKWVPVSGQQRLSNLVQAQFAGDMTCKFYPNPVDNMLIVRSEQPLDLLIIDQQGAIKINIMLKSGLQTVDLTRLEKGLYIINLTEKESGKVLTEKLVKN